MIKERNTQQKQLVAKIIKDADRPLNVQEILEIGKSKLPGLGIATIYREVARLCDADEIKTVNIPGDSPRYESLKNHHHHFKCTECNKVFEIEGCLKEVNKLVPQGFKPISHEITFYGACEVCV